MPSQITPREKELEAGIVRLWELGSAIRGGESNGTEKALMVVRRLLGPCKCNPPGSGLYCTWDCRKEESS